MSERIGDWMQVSSGAPFWPLDPYPEEIFIEDIAHALSRQNRYGGHIIPEHYSVAEHSWHLSHAVPEEFALAALLHDAPEGYIQDVIRPVKRELTNYRTIEIGLEKVIFAKFGVPFPIPAVVIEYDNRICADERDQVLAKPKRMWGRELIPLGIALPCWSPNVAKAKFLERFEELFQ